MATITVAELVTIYGSVLDSDTIGGIHAEARGLRSECVEQLSMISGIDAPPVTAGGGGDGSPSEGMSPQESSDVLVGDYYDSALPNEAEKKELERKKELNELMKRKVDDVGEMFKKDRAFDAEAKIQRDAGPQSLRGGSLDSVIKQIAPHSQECVRKMIEREKEHCGEFVCFYHSYSLSSLIYEVQACIARVLYGLPADFAPAPRLLKKAFRERPHMKTLLADFSQMQGQDGDPRFRAVAICASVSLHSPSSEAPPIQTFEGGYCLNHGDFGSILNGILKECGANAKDASTVVADCAKLAGKYKIHPEVYGAQGAGYGAAAAKSGQMLQVFVRVDCVDDVAYGALAYGVYLPGLNPPSEALTKKGKAPDGQARVFWHPSLFFDETKVKVYHYAANKDFHGKQRLALQKDLEVALLPLLGTPEKALHTYMCLEGLK